jgi:hypothetical protein
MAADLPTPRHGLTSAVVGDRWLVIGGATLAGARTLAATSGVVEILAVEPDEP